MKIAVCPGSFDPVTVGHIDIITRAAGLFDHVVVSVMVNANKKSSFNIDERIEFLKKSLSNLKNVEVTSFNGLLAKYARDIGATAIVRGLRAMSDFEYEFQMALTNKKLNRDIETVFLAASSKNTYLSSSMVKEVAYFGGDISCFVPKEVHDDIKKRLYKGE